MIYKEDLPTKNPDDLKYLLDILYMVAGFLVLLGGSFTFVFARIACEQQGIDGLAGALLGYVAPFGIWAVLIGTYFYRDWKKLRSAIQATRRP